MLTIKRRGNFTLDTTSPQQCSTEGQRDYKYFVTVTGKKRDINHETTFLIDNKLIDDVFQQDVDAASCEVMVIQAAEEIRELCLENFFKPRKITVEIFANDNASCEYVLE